MAVLDISQISDQGLMTSIASDDLVAWSEMVKRYGKLVYSISYQILKNNSDAEDAVQDTFISLKIYANQFDETQPLIPWLSRVAANQAIKIYKKKKNFTKKESVKMETFKDSSGLHNKDAAEIMEKKEVELLVKKAIDLLPEKSRVALTLYYAGGMNQTEIAKELGLSQFSISEKINMSLEKVKSYLKKAGVHASIAISPQLIKESIVSTPLPNGLVLKISSQLPSKTHVARVSSTSNKIVATSLQSSKLISGLILAAALIVVAGYFFIPKKSQSISTVPIAKANDKTIFEERKFKPLDFNGFVPFDSYKILEKDVVIKLGLSLIEKNNWLIRTDASGKAILVRDFYQPEMEDGIFFKNIFMKPGLFTGFVKSNKEKCKINFVLGAPQKSHEKSEALSHDLFISSQYQGIPLTLLPVKGDETEFRLFIWNDNKKFYAICFFYSNGKSLKEQDYYCWKDLINSEYILGVFTDGNIECHDFKYTELSDSWQPKEEPEIHAVLDKIPKEFSLNNQ